MPVGSLPSSLVSLRKRYAFWIDPDLDAGLKALKARDGMPPAEAIRRAIAEFLRQKRIATAGKADRSRGHTRKRP
jgi:hypothetical protein